MIVPPTVIEPSKTSNPSASIFARAGTMPAAIVGVVLGDADERRRERAERERERDSLRHRRHRHPLAHRIADDDAEDEAAGDPAIVDDRVVQQRADDGEQHADRRLLHAAPRLVGAREAAQPEDEQDRRERGSSPG